MWFGGIDVGFGGGLAALDPSRGLAEVIPMPTLRVTSRKSKNQTVLDLDKILDWVCSRAWGSVAVEKSQSMPGQGIVSTGRYMEGFGQLQGLLFAGGASYFLAPPKEWQRRVLGASSSDKSVAIAHCQNKWPGASLLKTTRSRKPSDGMADALCIAEFAALKASDDGERELAGTG